MAIAEEYLKFLPMLYRLPHQSMSISYDAVADVLYVQFASLQAADDSELTDDDIIVRYAGEDVIGYTILHASQRPSPQP